MVSKFSDVAVGNWKEDKLGFMDYAEGVIATIEDSSKADTPFAIGVFGGWGSGKTSFMRIMQGLLESRGYQTIFFNSWEYGNEEKPWIPFMIKIVDELFRYLFSWDKIPGSDNKRFLKILEQNYGIDWVKTAEIKKIDDGRAIKIDTEKNSLSLILNEEKTKVELKIAGGRTDKFNIKIENSKLKIYFENKIYKIDKIDTKELVKNIFLFATDIVLQTYSQGKLSKGGILDLIKRSMKPGSFKDWLDDDAKIVIERVNMIEEFKKTIQKRAEESQKGKIVIFIDDLDRIPEKLIDFLNSMKIFLDIRGCIFIIGCDYNILESALKQKYKEEIYEDYFDKIVQIEFYIPKLSEQAIKEYLQFLTDCSEDDSEICMRLVIHSIGGNPRKIKRVANETILIKNVFESKLATFLEEFERPKLRDKKIEEPQALEITRIFTPPKVFDILFDKEVLFKLVCMREQWPELYKMILSDENMHNVLISLQDDTKQDISKLLNVIKNKGETLKEAEKNLSFFLKDKPKFQKVEDIKTYLTLLEISSPEAGIFLEYAKPEMLPDNLFNRFLIFERIGKGKVDEGIIKKKINQMKWDSSLGSYHFFIEVISAFGYDILIKYLFETKIRNIIGKIKEITTVAGEIGWLLDSVRKIDGVAAEELLNKTKEVYTDKIRECKDLLAIGRLLDSVRMMDKVAAEELLNKTKEVYADKIIDSTNPGAIGWLLDSVRWIDEVAAKELLNKTKDFYADKVRDPSANPGAIGWLLDSVKCIDGVVAEELLNKTKEVYTDKIIDSTDPGAIGSLLDGVREINRIAAEELLNKTKEVYADKIIDSIDPGAIGRLLDGVGEINRIATEELLNKTKDVYADKIKASKDLLAIGWLLDSVRKIDGVAAEELLNKTKDVYADKIRECKDLLAINWLLDSVRKIAGVAAEELLKETNDFYADKLRAPSTNPGAIGWLLDIVREIDKVAAEELLNKTKEVYADKIKASKDLLAIRRLIDGVREIDKVAAEELLNKTKEVYADKIIDSTD